MSLESSPPTRSRQLRTALIIYTLAAVLVIPLSLFWAMMSAMATTTTSNTGFASAYVLVNMAFPALWLVGVIGGWIAWFARRDRLGWVLLAAPALPFILSAAMMIAWPSS